MSSSLAEIDLSRLFPKAQGEPVNGNDLLPNYVKHLHFLSWRNKGGKNKDDLRHIGSVPIGITKRGIDLEGRIVFRESNIVKLFQSFPPLYCLFGTENQHLECIGNSVPPMLMRAIATQIRHILWGGVELKPYPKTMKYLDILESAWQDHLKPREPNAPTVISTFAGGGGSSLGYSMAGYRELLAVEWDDNAVATFKLNFPDVPVYHGDIAKLSVEECLRMTSLKPGELDILDGSPPCQGFSTAGKRILDDPRNQLFREYVRLLGGLKPKVFVMENVSGMVKGKMKLIFAEIMRELKASGYKVSARLMNAMYFNVPQSRQRIIFIGVREDLEIEPSHPKAEGKEITPKIALDNCPDGEIKFLPDWLKEAAKYIDAGNYNHQSVERAFLKIRKNKAGSQNTKLLSWDRVSCTLVKEEISVTGIIHPNRERYLTIPEMKRIASFPDEFQFVGKRKDKVNRIGNSVPPLFMRAIARHLRQVILSQVNI